jgi:hypothetical protein
MNKTEFITKVESIGYLREFILPLVEIDNINLDIVYSKIKKSSPNLIDLYNEFNK